MALWPLFFLGAGLLGFKAAWARLEQQREHDKSGRAMLERMSFTRIVDLEPGQVAKVRGTIEALDAPLRPPFSSRDSVYYRAQGAVWHEDEQKHVAVLLAERSTDFFVVDETGRLLVRAGPLAYLVLKEQFARSAKHHAEREEVSKRFAEVLEDRELDYALVASLDIGEEVVVRGRIGDEPQLAEAGAAYRDQLTVQLTLIEDPDVERLVSDLPELVDGDGQKR